MADPSERRRRVNQAVFFGCVLGILALLQTTVVPLALGNFVTAAEAVRLTDTLRSATPGLLVALVVTFLYERSKDAAYERNEVALADRLESTLRRAFAEEDATRIERYLAGREPDELLDEALERMLGSGSATHSLSTVLAPGRRVFRNVAVELTIRDSAESPTEYVIETAQRAVVQDLPEITLACAIDPQTAFRISATCPEFSYIWSCESMSAVEQIARQASVQYRVEDGHSRWGPDQYSSFERVPDEEYPAYGITADLQRNGPVLLLRRRTPEGANRRIDYTVRSSGSFPRSARFAYHTEDHLSHVERIRIDWTNFTVPRGGLEHPALVPFFPLVGPLPAIDEQTRKVEIRLDQWLLPGTGVVFVW